MLDSNVDLDDAGRVQDLYDWASRVPLNSAVEWLKTFYVQGQGPGSAVPVVS